MKVIFIEKHLVKRDAQRVVNVNGVEGTCDALNAFLPS